MVVMRDGCSHHSSTKATLAASRSSVIRKAHMKIVRNACVLYVINPYDTRAEIYPSRTVTKYGVLNLLSLHETLPVERANVRDEKHMSEFIVPDGLYQHWSLVTGHSLIIRFVASCKNLSNTIVYSFYDSSVRVFREFITHL